MIDIGIITIPSRVQMAKALQERIGGGQIFCDMFYRGSWYNHRNAIEHLETSHFLILEDDILPCADFIDTVELISNHFSDTLVSFFNMKTYTKANKHSQRYFKTLGGTSQAILYPKDIALKFVRWASQIELTPQTISCDARRWAWNYCCGTSIVITNPNLVEHTLPLETEMKSSVRTLSMNRVSANFIGENRSGLSLNWTPHAVPFIYTTNFTGYWRERNIEWSAYDS